MKKKTATKLHGKLNINQETIRRLSELGMRAVHGGITSGHITCDSAFCASFNGDTCN